jgi:DNA-binding NtrC family response regulator
VGLASGACLAVGCEAETEVTVAGGAGLASADHVSQASRGVATAMRDGAVWAPAQERSADGDLGLGLKEQLGRVEERLTSDALSRAGGNRTKAAKLLGVSRNGLSMKMERLGIET